MKNRLIQFSFILVTLSTVILISCDKDEEEPDVYGINYKQTETINAVVVDTQAGWTLLSETYGFLEFLESLNDSLKVDGMKVKADIYRGKTYYDDGEASLDNWTWMRNFTFAELISIEGNPTLYAGSIPPLIEIFWSPDWDDNLRQYPDGYGCFIQASEEGFKIRVIHFPAIAGLGSFKTEVEAYKMGAYIMHLMMISNDLPGTGILDMDFLKIDWYIYFPPS